MNRFVRFWQVNARNAWASSWELVFSSIPRVAVSCLIAVVAAALTFLATADKNGFQSGTIRALAALGAVLLVVAILCVGNLLFWAPFVSWRDTDDSLQRILGDPKEEMSLASLVRYIAEQSVWTQTLDPQFDDFALPLSVAIKDWFVALDSPTIFGRRFGPSGPVRDAVLEPITKAFWINADIDTITLLMNGQNLGPEYSLVYERNRTDRLGGYLDVRVNASAARQKWLPLPRGQGPTNRYIRAVANYRETGQIT